MSGPFYPVVVTQLGEEEGGGYMAQVIDLLGCMAWGETPQQALGHAQIATIEWLREARRLGRPVPEPNSIVRRAGRARSEAGDLIRKQQQLIRAQAAMIDRQRDQADGLRRDGEGGPLRRVPLSAADAARWRAPA
ncbi:type II toxin-antitoxin system HicB family antitoxin [Enterovirga aerilata]|uniref:type II toxin-antitoxin system HicB family antitoxin n=1 Tax=Enterovirga aerilata TaxID=2730920 RepID=UPI0015843E56|nr:type II toxin-antitoxin system HicB family antitoxin [Enterovirga sp. DB1703]